MALEAKDSDDYRLGGINAYNTKDDSGNVTSDYMLSFGNKSNLRNLISRRTKDYGSITHLSNNFATDIVNVQKAVNQIIQTLENHGLIDTYVIPPTTFSISTSNYDEKNKTIDVTYSFTAGYDVYGSGLAYSSTNKTPIKNNNNIKGSSVSPVTVTLQLGSGLKRYVRIYLDKVSNPNSDSDREYSATYTITNKGIE